VRSFPLSMSAQDTSFAKLVSLACHDLRTPLATVFGFARTLTRSGDLAEPAGRYVAMIESASEQLGELLDELSLAARIAGGRYDPKLEDADTAELARAAAERLGAERVAVSGAGSSVRVDVEAMERAVSALAQCALRHGGLDEVSVIAGDGSVLIAPITKASAPVVLGEDMRDLGAAVAVRAIKANGGQVSLEGETLTVSFPG
jgi:signal transduction histidine kinase